MGHRGVGALVTNLSRTQFFLQQKDAEYVAYPRCYSLFGGAVEEGESPLAGLRRELKEELGAAASFGDAVPSLRLSCSLPPTSFQFTLYEFVVASATLAALECAPIFEGERAALVDRKALTTLPFVWNLDVAIANYLTHHGLNAETHFRG